VKATDGYLGCGRMAVGVSDTAGPMQVAFALPLRFGSATATHEVCPSTEHSHPPGAELRAELQLEFVESARAVTFVEVRVQYINVTLRQSHGSRCRSVRGARSSLARKVSRLYFTLAAPACSLLLLCLFEPRRDHRTSFTAYPGIYGQSLCIGRTLERKQPVRSGIPYVDRPIHDT
jgi:hypothetical protein